MWASKNQFCMKVSFAAHEITTLKKYRQSVKFESKNCKKTQTFVKSIELLLVERKWNTGNHNANAKK